MGLLQPESLLWIDQIESLKGTTRKECRAELKKAYSLGASQITYLLAIRACFDQPAFNKVRQAAQTSQTPFILSLNSAMALAGLKGGVSDLPTAIHAALDIVLAQKLTTRQIKALVAWMVAGNSAETFDTKTAVKPPRHQDTKEDEIEKGIGEEQANHKPIGKNPLDLKKVRQLLEKAETERIQGTGTSAEEKLKTYLQKVVEPLSSPAGISPPFSKSKASGRGPQKASPADEPLSETVVLDWLADINIIKQLQARRKKGKSLTLGQWSLLAGHKGFEVLGHLAKMIMKLFKPLFKIIHWVWKLVVEALKELGLYKYAKAIFTLVAVVAAIWFAWEAFHYGVMRPVEMVWSRIHKPVAVEETPVPTEQPTLVPQTPISSVGLGQSKRASRPVVSTQMYHPSVSFQPAQYDPNLLEIEVDSIAPHSLVKDFPVTPDEGMPGDLAVSRLQDLTNTDKYTMKLGHGTEKILSVNPSTTTLTLNYKSADALGGFLGGSGQMNFFWEDVKVIHINALYSGALIQSNPVAPLSGTGQLVASPQMPVIYQCSLIVSGTKNPLTIQCASVEDLNHLVSTMEYFIRNSRLGHDTALAGMPFSFQGVRLTNDRVVDKLWADSPMDKAGVSLGDHLWSVGKAAIKQQNEKNFEAGLSSLPVNLYIVSPADWNKAATTQNGGAPFSPKLKKVVLAAN